MTSCRSSRRTPLPSFGGTSVSLVAFAPRRTSAPPRPGVGNPVSPAGMLPRKRQDLPSSWGTPIVRLHMFQSDSGRTAAPDHYGAATWPLVFQKQRLPRKVFRSSIAWLSDSLSTLRRTGYPATTQDSLPAAGQALPDGLSTRKVPTKGFRFASLHLIPPSQALLGARQKKTDFSRVLKDMNYGRRNCYILMFLKHHVEKRWAGDVNCIRMCQIPKHKPITRQTTNERKNAMADQILEVE